MSEPKALNESHEPEYVYAPSREEAQRPLDNSYLTKYRAVRVRWWHPTPNAQPTTMGFARWLYVLGLMGGWLLHWAVTSWT